MIVSVLWSLEACRVMCRFETLQEYSQDATLRASEKNSVWATILNPFYNMVYEIIDKTSK